jgi:NAD(P)-dependent dehydrogenase (short-subunit alcohol dehydrogenase family)
MNLEKRIVVVTGATRGLGQAMAAEFIAQGHLVAGCGRSVDGLQHLAHKFGDPHLFTPLNVAEDEEVEAWARLVLDKLGPPSLLINNAGIINHNAPLWKISPAEFDSVIDINVKGVANVLRHFLPAMIKIKAGVIVNFSSGWGRSTSADVAPYCASKWAIEGLTQALAQELPPGMAAIPFNPGIINTQMLQSCFGSSAGAYPTPEQWARRAVPFLLGLGPKQNGQPLDLSI